MSYGRQKHGRDRRQFIQVDQQQRQFFRLSLGDVITTRVFSSPGREAQQSMMPGQDVLAMIANEATDTLCFCLADGVGASIHGDFAAQLVATRLTRWLDDLPRLIQKDDLRPALSVALTHWAREAHAAIAHLPPPSLPPLAREVYEEVFVTHGGEAVFCGGRVDCDETEIHYILCALGNVRAEPYSTSSTDPDFTLCQSDDHRWSTVSGQCGEIAIMTGVCPMPFRLVLSSDGAQALSGNLSDDELQRSADQVDDVLIFDALWRRGEN